MQPAGGTPLFKPSPGSMGSPPSVSQQLITDSSHALIYQVSERTDTKGALATKAVCFTQGPLGNTVEARDQLYKSYTDFFKQAREVNVSNPHDKPTVVTMSPISAGGPNIPKDEAATIALAAAKEFLKSVPNPQEYKIVFVTYDGEGSRPPDKESFKAYEKKIKELPQELRGSLECREGKLQTVPAHLTLVAAGSQTATALINSAGAENPQQAGRNINMAPQTSTSVPPPTDLRAAQLASQVKKGFTGFIADTFLGKKGGSTTPVQVQSVSLTSLLAGVQKLTTVPFKQALRGLFPSERAGDVKIYMTTPPTSLKAVGQQKVKDNHVLTVIKTDKPYGASDLPDSRIRLIAGDTRQGGVAYGPKFAQEEIANEESPALLGIMQQKLLGTKEGEEVYMRRGPEGPQRAYVGGISSGGYLQGIPLECQIHVFQRFSYISPSGEEVTVNSLYAGEMDKQFKLFAEKMGIQNPQEAAQAFLKMLQEKGVLELKKPPVAIDYIYLVAPVADPSKPVSVDQTLDLMNSFTQGYAAALSANKGAPTIVLPAGWVGTGAFNNNYHTAALSQFVSAHFAASELQEDPPRPIQMVFHDAGPAETRAARARAFDEAQKYYQTELMPLIQKGATKAQIAEKIAEEAKKRGWTNNPLSTH